VKTFIGTKRVKAKPMTRGEYNLYRNWTNPKDENPLDEGFLVEYLNSSNSNHKNHKNYISWSPKQIFNNAYQDISKEVSFSTALTFLKLGKSVKRKGWNGKGMFVYLVPAASYPPQTQVAIQAFNGENVFYEAYLAIKTAQNTVNTWVPSISDVLAEDYQVDGE
jgi:hypothetical protein